MKKVACAKCGGAMKKMAKGGTMKTTVGKATPKGQIYGIPQTGPTGPNYQGVDTMKKGGMVKKKYAKGGSSFGMLSVKAGIDKNPKPTAADRIAGAKMKKGGLVKKQLGGPATPNYPNPTKTLENAALFVGGGLATALAARKQNQPMTEKKKQKVLAKQQKKASKK